MQALSLDNAKRPPFSVTTRLSLYSAMLEIIH